LAALKPVFQIGFLGILIPFDNYTILNQPNWRVTMSDIAKPTQSKFEKLKMKKISKSESKHIRRMKQDARNEAIPMPVKKK